MFRAENKKTGRRMFDRARLFGSHRFSLSCPHVFLRASRGFLVMALLDSR
jgi:hypothetical protein